MGFQRKRTTATCLDAGITQAQYFPWEIECFVEQDRVITDRVSVLTELLDVAGTDPMSQYYRKSALRLLGHYDFGHWPF